MVCPAISSVIRLFVLHTRSLQSIHTVAGRKHSASWTRQQFVAGPMQKDTHGVAVTRTPTDNLVSAIVFLRVDCELDESL